MAITNFYTRNRINVANIRETLVGVFLVIRLSSDSLEMTRDDVACLMQDA